MDKRLEAVRNGEDKEWKAWGHNPNCLFRRLFLDLPIGDTECNAMDSGTLRSDCFHTSGVSEGDHG